MEVNWFVKKEVFGMMVEMRNFPIHLTVDRNAMIAYLTLKCWIMRKMKAFFSFPDTGVGVMHLDDRVGFFGKTILDWMLNEGANRVDRRERNYVATPSILLDEGFGSFEKDFISVELDEPISLRT